MKIVISASETQGAPRFIFSAANEAASVSFFATEDDLIRALDALKRWDNYEELPVESRQEPSDRLEPRRG